jgi:hypothetical protein
VAQVDTALERLVAIERATDVVPTADALRRIA